MLLSGLGVVFVIVMFGSNLIVPLYCSNVTVSQSMKVNEERMIRIEQNLNGLGAAKAEHVEKQEYLARLRQSFYPIMNEMDINMLFIVKAAEYDLEVKVLQVSIEEQATSISPFSGEERAAGNLRRNPDGVHLANVSIQVCGAMERLDSLMDDVVQNMPGIWPQSFSWRSDDSKPGSGQWILSMQLKMGMVMK
ncbi:MAG: hypothetical protein ACRDBO_00995 [Lachnospiraceae bacterium]